MSTMKVWVGVKMKVFFKVNKSAEFKLTGANSNDFCRYKASENKKCAKNKKDLWNKYVWRTKIFEEQTGFW